MLLVLLCFGIGTNLAVPITQRYGALPAMLNAQAIAFVLVLPYAVTDVAGSTFAWDSFLAILALGVTSGAIALIAMSTLASRVGAPRANVAIYFIPIVAIVLGVVVRDETVEAIALGGIVLVLIGAFVTSRADARRNTPHPAASQPEPIALPRTRPGIHLRLHRNRCRKIRPQPMIQDRPHLRIAHIKHEMIHVR